MQMVPTGFHGVPPSGPAMPEVARPKVAPARSRTSAAIAATQASETAPSFSRYKKATVTNISTQAKKGAEVKKTTPVKETVKPAATAKAETVSKPKKTAAKKKTEEKVLAAA